MSRVTGYDLTRSYVADNLAAPLGSEFIKDGVKYKLVQLNTSTTYWYGAPLMISEVNVATPLNHANANAYAFVDGIMPYLAADMTAISSTLGDPFGGSTHYYVTPSATKYCWVPISGVVSAIVCGSASTVSVVTTENRIQLVPALSGSSSISGILGPVTSSNQTLGGFRMSNIVYLSSGTTGITIASVRMASVKITN